MRKNSFNFLPYVILFLLSVLLLFSCDTFDEDQVEEAIPLEGDKKIVILPETSAVIDFSKLVNARGEVKGEITGTPEFGTISELGTNLLKYSATKDVKSGKDVIPFNIYGSDNNFLFTDKVEILITDQAIDSCAVFAIEDIFYIKPDSSIALDVLSNDLICDSLGVDLSIVQGPSKGTAQVNGDKITYLTTQGDVADQFVYRISTKTDPVFTSDALVMVYVGDSLCSLKARPDSFNYNQNATGGFNVLANDDICSENVTASITNSPRYGIASFDFENMLSYIPETNEKNYIDTLAYKICEGGNCSEALVFMQVSECDSLLAMDDEVYLADSTLTGAMRVDVLANDLLCTSATLSITTDPNYGTAYVEGNAIYYDPEQEVNVDSLVYSICDGQALCDEATLTFYR